ncbi:hypothetical protein Poly24_22770 [Rosistilla carotiformis]|uniref:Uncharacterized protein n=1 Tax=Rosistilla carotiformis TaxID=2528017 RepID=A0A518JSQ5_9BACT|nr:hypothetical protein Poly24_22770 [Rosistilla carotiformis]
MNVAGNKNKRASAKPRPGHGRMAKLKPWKLAIRSPFATPNIKIAFRIRLERPYTGLMLLRVPKNVNTAPLHWWIAIRYPCLKPDHAPWTSAALPCFERLQLQSPDGHGQRPANVGPESELDLVAIG